jgi:hypothetical protein
MKVTDLLETNQSDDIEIETDTGRAVLSPDYSMFLDNKGYTQYLTPDQVLYAWGGGGQLPLSDDDIRDMKMDGIPMHDMDRYAPKLHGKHWEFGDGEYHTIPSANEFGLK